MTTCIILAIYVIGVWVAFFQVQKWYECDTVERDECQLHFILSMLSWMIYPIYGTIWLINKAREK